MIHTLIDNYSKVFFWVQSYNDIGYIFNELNFSKKDVTIVPPTIEKLDEALAYAESRREAYPPIQEQLDLLFHEMTASGSLSISGSWFNTVKAVKDANPKP